MESALYDIYALVVFVSEILLVRCAHSFDFWYVNNLCVNTVRQHFPWSILYVLNKTLCRWYAGLYGTARGTKKNVEELQKHFTRLEYWSDDWKLRFDTLINAKWCIILKKTYNLCGNNLKGVSEVKNLGIRITSNLSWSLQAKKCANKADSVLGLWDVQLLPEILSCFPNFIELSNSNTRVLLSSVVPAP